MSDTEIHVRLYPEEKAKIRGRAARHDMSMSEYLRTLVEREERGGLIQSIYPGQIVETIKQ
jgi:plasmid stability protein